MDPSLRPQQIAFALTAAVAIGIVLGNSTVTAIDPAYFRDAATPPRAFAAAAAPGPPEIPYYGRPASYGDPAVMRAALCPGCDGPPVVAGAYLASVPYFGSREERAAIEAGERRAIDVGYAARERARESHQGAAGIGGPLIDEADLADGERPDAAGDPGRDEGDAYAPHPSI